MKPIVSALAALLLALPGAAAAQQATDPIRQAAAQQTVDHVFPTGSYARMMESSLDAVMDSVVSQVAQMPLAQLARIGGLSQEETANLGDARLSEIMAIYDPAYHERMSLSMDAMFGEMSGVMAKVEPEMRSGLVNAYAKRFTAEELQEMNRFFATPTGAHYARESLMIFVDPAVMEKMQAMVPVLMEEMPGIMEKAKAATAHLPPPRSREDLSEDERARLEALFGVSKK